MLVPGPELYAFRKDSGRQQVDVDQSQATSYQHSGLDKFEDFGMGSFRRFRKPVEETKNYAAIAKIPARQLADDEGMGHYFASIQGVGERRLHGTEMIDPH